MSEGPEPWFVARSVYPTFPQPIHREGRRAMLILVFGMCAALPAIGVIAWSGVGPDWAVPLVLGTCFVCFILVPAWFLWKVRKRIRIVE